MLHPNENLGRNQPSKVCSYICRTKFLRYGLGFRNRETSDLRSPKVSKLDTPSLPSTSQISGIHSSDPKKRKVGESSKGPVSRKLRTRRTGSVLQEVDQSSSESDSDIATTEPEASSPLGKEADQHHRTPATSREVEGAASTISGSSRSVYSPSSKSKFPHSGKPTRKHTSRKSFTTTTGSSKLSASANRGESSRKIHNKAKEIEGPGIAKSSQSTEIDTAESA